jgi:hypothetical protein
VSSEAFVVVQPSAGDAGGYADAAAQDAFCANTVCWITMLYDQSGKGNHLVQAHRGGFSGPAMGGFNNLPLADMAPLTITGHKVYGVFIALGMGLRWNNAKGTAVDDQAEGQYWVINGHHYNSGCCFDYGNAVPKLVFGSRWVIPEVYDADDLVSILQDSLAVPKP